MVRKPDNQEVKIGTDLKQDKGKVYVEERYFRHVDQEERWRQEYEHCQAVENKLEEVSKLTYEEFDYSPQLERSAFVERPIPDFSYMLEEAKAIAESKFVKPIMIHVILSGLLLFMLIVINDTLLLWLCGTGVFTVVILLFLLIQRRQIYIKRVVTEKQKEIDLRIAYEQKKNEEAKARHEKTENERIRAIELLLEGDTSAVFARTENVLGKLKFSFHLNAEIDLYNKVPAIRVWLPPKYIIPIQVCILQPSGRIIYKDKEPRAINKQYLELCAAIIMKIAGTLYSNIPSFDIGYIYGMSKEDLDEEFLFIGRINRETVKLACNAASGLEAVRIVKAKFEYDTTLQLLPIEFEPPKEWNGMEQRFVRRLSVNLFK